MVGMGRWCGMVVIFALVGGVPSGHVAMAQVDASRDAEARGLFDAAMAAYDDGRFDDAYAYFERSHALSGRPQLLFNLASTCERLRRDGDAIAYYERYLAEVPDADNRRFVEGRVAFLRAAVRRAAGGEAGGTPRGDGPTGDAGDESVAPRVPGDSSDVGPRSATPDTPTAAGDPPRTSRGDGPSSRRGLRIGLGVSLAALASGGAAVGAWIATRSPGVQDPLRGDVGAGGVVVTLIGAFGP